MFISGDFYTSKLFSKDTHGTVHYRYRFKAISFDRYHFGILKRRHVFLKS